MHFCDRVVSLAGCFVRGEIQTQEATGLSNIVHVYLQKLDKQKESK